MTDDDSFVFDSNSGFYKPKSCIPEERDHDGEGRLRVSVARDNIAIWISSITLAIVAVSTYYSMRSVQVMKAGEERAQIILGDERIVTKPPEFIPVLQGGGGIKDLRPATTLAISFPLTINNVGKKVAERYSVFGDLIAETQDSGYIPMQPRGAWWKESCDAATGNMEGQGAPSQTPLFPGITKIMGHGSTDFLLKPQHVRRVFLISCVAYRETSGDEHFSAIMYCPFEAVDPHPIKVFDDPDIFFDEGVFSGFMACGHATDEQLD